MGKGRLKGKLPDDVVAFFAKAGKRGGKLSAEARMEKISPERRQEIARQAGLASAAKRWGKKAAVKKEKAK